MTHSLCKARGSLDRLQGTPESPHIDKWGMRGRTTTHDNEMEREMGSPRSPRGRVARNYEHQDRPETVACACTLQVLII